MTLRARGIRHAFGVAGVDLDIVEHQLTLLVGRNGSGKSTLLRILAGVLLPEQGEVTLGGQELRSLPAKERARRIAFVPQDVDCPFEFTVDEFVGMGRYPHLGRFGGLTPADTQAIASAMDAVRVRAFGPRPVTELSGGEFRRVAIARALATEADTLLLDEPTANLDLEHQIELLELLRTLVQCGRTAIVTSHDFNLTVPMADQVVVLRNGTVFCHDEPEAALTPQTLADVFGVSSCPETGPFPRAFGRLPQDPEASRRGDDAGNSPSSS